MTDPHAYEYSIESVENAARTLLMLREKPSIRAVDVATELGVARSTAHRMVSTLAQSGLLRRDDNDKSYRAGYALVELGMAVIGAADIRSEVGPSLASLAASTGETTHFLVREGHDVLFVSVAEGTHVIRAVPRVGTRLPAHVTSAGRCILAAMPRSEVSALYPAGQRLRGGTDRAFTSTAQLTRDLDDVAAQGFAVNRSQSEPGLTAVSVAIRDARGSALGAISVSGPTDRIDPAVDAIVEALQSEVQRLEGALARGT